MSCVHEKACFHGQEQIFSLRKMNKMRKTLSSTCKYALLLGIICLTMGCQSTYPEVIHVEGGKLHVQGIALDKKDKCLYCSFTSAFFKTDLKGNIIPVEQKSELRNTARCIWSLHVRQRRQGKIVTEHHQVRVPNPQQGQTILKHWSLEQRKVYYKAMQGDGWLMPYKPQCY